MKQTRPSLGVLLATLVRLQNSCENDSMLTAVEHNINIPQLANCTVFAAPDRQLMLGQLWQKQTAVMIFLRHFACISCRAHAAQVWKERAKYQSSGAKIIFIGNGQPVWIEMFREDLGIDKGVILTDPSLNSFKAAGFKSGFFNIVNPKSVINIIKLVGEGHSQNSQSKDSGTHLQLGGILAITPQNKIVYHYSSNSIGDFPEEPYREIIEHDEKEL